MTISAAGGWCAPNAPSAAIVDLGGSLDLPAVSVARGGIDFNAPRTPGVAIACSHFWERESPPQCSCPQCVAPDDRLLKCVTCRASLSPDDEDFEALYEVALWWWDSE